MTIVNQVVTIPAAMAGGTITYVVWPCAMPLRIYWPQPKYSACRAVRIPASAPCLMNFCNGLLPEPGMRSRSMTSTAIRECMTATVENS